MKFGTEWWGVQFLAETKEDADVLKALIASLPEKAEYCYEDGEYDVINKDDAKKCYPFSREDIKGARLIVGFSR